jgi:hypothetical protein
MHDQILSALLHGKPYMQNLVALFLSTSEKQDYL